MLIAGHKIFKRKYDKSGERIRKKKK